MRITDANQKFTLPEPKFIGSISEISKLDLITSLNWYSSNKSSKDAEEYAERYFKTKLKYAEPIKDIIPTFGFLCRIITNGGILSEKDQSWFNEQIEILKKNNKKISTTEKSSVVEQPKPNIQDRIKEKTNECIAELEGLIDELITSKFKAIVSPFTILHTLEIKNTKDIIEYFRIKRKEFDEVLITTDEQLLEGYSNFTKIQLKKLIGFCDAVILDCNKISQENRKTITRKPRTRKVKTPDQILAKFNYCQEFSELNLKSVDSKLILGATQLWIYNTKYKKLGVYYSSDASGFSVLGTTLKNFDETRSIQKIIRKPEITLSEFYKATKVGLRTFLNKITTREIPLTGRFGSDTVLLKIVK